MLVRFGYGSFIQNIVRNGHFWINKLKYHQFQNYCKMGETLEHHGKSIKTFAIIILVLQIIIGILYCVFVRIDTSTRASEETNIIRYPAYQDVNVMMLIGFGFLMTFIKSHAWSALSFTFFINAIIVQLYILLSAFWERIVVSGFSTGNYFISIRQSTFTSASYAVASILIAFGGVLGRVGPKQFLIMSLVQIVGYSLNEQIVYKRIEALDVGGSMVIHTFGAYFGLTVSRFLSAHTKPTTKPESSYISNIFGMIGTIFLWMYWPSFNFGAFGTTDFTKSQIITNTILSLTGSCLTTFMMSAFLKDRFTMQHILNATLAGGVVIGAPAGIIYNPGASLIIGMLIGAFSTICFQYLTPKLQQKIGLHDTCGIHNLHGLPGLIGGILSAIAVASYKHSTNYSADLTVSIFPDFPRIVADPYHQGGLQLAGTFVSMGMGIVFGIIAGLILKHSYSFKQNQFFQDKVYFQDAQNQKQLQSNSMLIKATSGNIQNINETTENV